MRSIIKFPKKEINVSLKVPNPHNVCFQYTVPFYSHHVFQLGVLGFPPYFPTGKRKAWEPNQATLSMLWAGGIGLAIDKQIKEGSGDT